MEHPFTTIPSIAASGERYSAGIISLVGARALSVTVRLTCGASLDQDPTIELYYSPDGDNWDSIVYTSFDITHTGGATIQRTAFITPPEHGYLKLKVKNNSSADSMTNIKMWYSIASWWPVTGNGHYEGNPKSKAD